MKTRVDIEDVLRLQQKQAEINKLEFKDIEWYKNGEKIEIDQKIIDQFDFTGMNNIDFIISGYYEQPEDLSQSEFVDKRLKNSIKPFLISLLISGIILFLKCWSMG